MQPSKNRDSRFALTPSRTRDSRFASTPMRKGRLSSFYRTSAIGMKESKYAISREMLPTLQKELYDFLAERSYEGLYPDMFRSPTRKELAFIFEFLMRQLDVNYCLSASKKIEEEIPHLLRNLDCPIELKKSTMQAMGASHTLPVLIGALHWLMQFVVMAGKIKPLEFIMQHDEGDGTKKTLEYACYVRAYKNFTQHGNRDPAPADYIDECAEVTKILDANDDKIREVAELNAAKEALENEIQEIDHKENYTESLTAALNKVQTDLDELQNHLKSREEDLHRKKLSMETSEECIEGLIKQMEKLQDEIDKNEKIVSEQKLTKDESVKIIAETNILKEKLNLGFRSQKFLSLDVESNMEKASSVKFRLQKNRRDHIQCFAELSRQISNKFGVNEISITETEFPEFLQTARDKYSQLNDCLMKIINTLESDLFLSEKKIDELKTEYSEMDVRLNELEILSHDRQFHHSMERKNWTDEIHTAESDLKAVQNEEMCFDDTRKSLRDLTDELTKMKAQHQAQKLELEKGEKEVLAAVLNKLNEIMAAFLKARMHRLSIRKFEQQIDKALDVLEKDFA